MKKAKKTHDISAESYLDTDGSRAQPPYVFESSTKQGQGQTGAMDPQTIHLHVDPFATASDWYDAMQRDWLNLKASPQAESEPVYVQF